MMIETGVDILEIKRIREIVEKTPRFLERFFTGRERAYFESKNYKVETIAGNFAAKEAVAKAMGTGVRGFNLIDLEILRDDQGKPLVYLHNEAEKIASNLKIQSFSLSISHSEQYAVAFAIAIKIR